jgi:hypothetical protein
MEEEFDKADPPSEDSPINNNVDNDPPQEDSTAPEGTFGNEIGVMGDNQLDQTVSAEEPDKSQAGGQSEERNPDGEEISESALPIEGPPESSAIADSDNLDSSDTEEIPGDTVGELTPQPKPIYETASVRRPINIADVGREGTAFYHIFGNDITRRGNLHLVEDEIIVYVCGNAVIFENIISKTKDYLLGLDDAGVGCVAVHPSR